MSGFSPRVVLKEVRRQTADITTRREERDRRTAAHLGISVPAVP